MGMDFMKPAQKASVIDKLLGKMDEPATMTYEQHRQHVNETIIAAINEVRRTQGEFDAFRPTTYSGWESEAEQRAKTMIQEGKDPQGIIASALEQYEQDRKTYVVDRETMQKGL